MWEKGQKISVCFGYRSVDKARFREQGPQRPTKACGKKQKNPWPLNISPTSPFSILAAAKKESGSHSQKSDGKNRLGALQKHKAWRYPVLFSYASLGKRPFFHFLSTWKWSRVKSERRNWETVTREHFNRQRRWWAMVAGLEDQFLFSVFCGGSKRLQPKESIDHERDQKLCRPWQRWGTRWKQTTKRFIKPSNKIRTKPDFEIDARWARSCQYFAWKGRFKIM